MSEEERQAIIHLLDKQARYEYARKNNISFSDEDYEAYIIRQSMIDKDKEIERLNNIINELEKWLEEQHQFIIEIPAYTKEISIEHKTMEICYENVLDKLQELLGSDKDN